MNPTIARTIVERYLEAEATEDLLSLTALFAAEVTVRNAANPPDAGPGAVERFALSFWDRTTTRSFELTDTAIDDDGNIFSFGSATITFRAGATFGPVAAKAPFTVTLPLALRLHVDEAGLVDELDVHHETTTAVLLAAGEA